jgi:hypothetical protein
VRDDVPCEFLTAYDGSALERVDPQFGPYALPMAKP